MKVTIDRFEGDFAVVEKTDRTIMNVKRSQLPADAKEGDILNIEGDTFTIDAAETTKRKQKIKDLMKELWNKKK
jgi:hypothetical protein